MATKRVAQPGFPGGNGINPLYRPDAEPLLMDGSGDDGGRGMQKPGSNGCSTGLITGFFVISIFALTAIVLAGVALRNTDQGLIGRISNLMAGSFSFSGSGIVAGSLVVGGGGPPPPPPVKRDASSSHHVAKNGKLELTPRSGTGHSTESERNTHTARAGCEIERVTVHGSQSLCGDISVAGMSHLNNTVVSGSLVAATGLIDVLTIRTLDLQTTRVLRPGQGPSPYLSGVRYMFLRDSSRAFDSRASFLGAAPLNGVRTLHMSITYPVDRSEPGLVLPPTYSAYCNDNQTVFASISELQLIRQRSYVDAPIASSASPFPVIIMSHGVAESIIRGIEHQVYLAQQGYVVIAITHTGEQSGTRSNVVGMDLQFATNNPDFVFGINAVTRNYAGVGALVFWALATQPIYTATTISYIVQDSSERTNDVKTVVDLIDQLAGVLPNSHISHGGFRVGADASFLTGKIDSTKLGIMGHSYGGSTTQLILQGPLAPRFKAGVLNGALMQNIRDPNNKVDFRQLALQNGQPLPTNYLPGPSPTDFLLKVPALTFDVRYDQVLPAFELQFSIARNSSNIPYASGVFIRPPVNAKFDNPFTNNRDATMNTLSDAMYVLVRNKQHENLGRPYDFFRAGINPITGTKRAPTVGRFVQEGIVTWTTTEFDEPCFLVTSNKITLFFNHYLKTQLTLIQREELIRSEAQVGVDVVEAAFA